MKAITELTDYYYEALSPTIEKLEKERVKLKNNIILVVSFLTIISLTALFFASSASTSSDVPLFIIFGYHGAVFISYYYMIKDYRAKFKDKIIKPLINAIDESLTYSSSSHIPQETFNNSKIFSYIENIDGNDLVEGEIDKTKFMFSDIKAKKRYKTSNGTNKTKTIFRGLFIVAEFNKNFTGRTVVLPDFAEKGFGKLIGGWLQSKNADRDELIKMDNDAFEKEFVIYSSDQIEARYILSHSLMEKILTFKEKSKYPLYLSFIENKIYIGINYKKDLFEPTVFRSLLKSKVAMEYIETLHLAIGVVEELKLNKKLWSVE